MRRVSALLLLLMPAALTAAQPGAAAPGKPPTALVATAASRSSVALSWTAGDPALTKYVVERKPLGASWTPPPPPAKPVIVTTPAAATTLEDTSVDTYATYVYRVRALGVNDAPSAPDGARPSRCRSTAHRTWADPSRSSSTHRPVRRSSGTSPAATRPAPAGLPKLIRQADASRWTNCAPETKGTPTRDEFSPVLGVAGNTKLYIAFRSAGAETGLKPGILLWRER